MTPKGPASTGGGSAEGPPPGPCLPSPTWGPPTTDPQRPGGCVGLTLHIEGRTDRAAPTDLPEGPAAAEMLLFSVFRLP